jgi:hypothetical protein
MGPIVEESPQPRRREPHAPAMQAVMPIRQRPRLSSQLSVCRNENNGNPGRPFLSVNLREYPSRRTPPL